jgi:ABC-type transporter Mla subunit MlaD
MAMSAEPSASGAPSPAGDALELAISEVEGRLAGLALALREPGSRGVDTAATDLHRALAQALDRFNQNRSPISQALRQRLARASAQVAAHRDTLARATAALDRAIDVLLPRDSTVYDASGSAVHAAHTGVLKA